MHLVGRVKSPALLSSKIMAKGTELALLFQFNEVFKIQNEESAIFFKRNI